MVNNLDSKSIQLLLLNCKGDIKKSVGSIPEFAKEFWENRHLYDHIPLLESILSQPELLTNQTLSFPRVEVCLQAQIPHFYNINLRRCKIFNPEIYVRCWIEDVTQSCLHLLQVQQRYQQVQIDQQIKL
ncbi:MAG: hypothetical protein AAGI23_06425 [Bacteroidota bacterium]